MLYRSGVDSDIYYQVSTSLAAYYLWECGPDTPEWHMMCALYGRAVEDLGNPNRANFHGWMRKQFEFWDTYDFLRDYTMHFCDLCDADPWVLMDILIFEYDDEWVYDFFPNQMTGCRGACVIEDNPDIINQELH